MDQKQSERVVSYEPEQLPEEFKYWEKPFGFEQHYVSLVLVGIIPHLMTLYYFAYMLPFGIVSRWTLLAVIFTEIISGLGFSVSAHRYYSHKSFKANKPLQYLLMLLQTSTYQYPIFKWVQDHRAHHKFQDTNGDPYNPSAGFFFSHLGWAFVPKHPDVEKSLKIVDMSDLINDPIVRFQSKHYVALVNLTGLAIPAGFYLLFFPELSFLQLFILNAVRSTILVHNVGICNSIAHRWGDKPYDKYIAPADSRILSFFAFGEGWHNYHHTFPWDYKSSELGFRPNLSTAFINFFAYIGWAWDLKTVSHKLLAARINRTGDENHPLHRNNRNNSKESSVLEGNENDNVSDLHFEDWKDVNLKKEDIEILKIEFPIRRNKSN